MVGAFPARRPASLRQVRRAMLRTLRGLGDSIIPAAPSIPQLLSQAAAQYGLDPALVLAVARRESGLNPSIVNAKSGAAGVMQLEPATAAELGVTNILDPVQNINAGVRYLAQLFRRYSGDAAKALAAYDWGMGRLDNAIAQWGEDWLSHAPGETRRYVAAIAGVSSSTPPGQSDSTPLTIDAATGLPVEDTTDVSQLPAAGGMSRGTILALTLGSLGVYLLADSFFGDS